MHASLDAGRGMMGTTRSAVITLILALIISALM